MSSGRDHSATLDEARLPVRAKLAAAWTSFMFLYAYVDILGFFVPGKVEDILAGVVFEFDISQTFVVTALSLMAVPIFMIVLSVLLPARANRATNLVIASFQVPYAVFNVLGESWTIYYWLAVVLEVALLATILRLAWTWPRTTTLAAATASTTDAEPLQLQSRA